MSQPPVYEKQEKQEKEEEKRRQEEEKQEKSTEEKYRRDPLGAVIWALILVWAGVVLLAQSMGLLNSIESASIPILRGWGFVAASAWSLIFMGVGVIVLGEVVVRLLVPAYRRPIVGSVIFAIVMLALGTGNLMKWDLIWPVVLILIGLSILARGLGARRQ